MPILYIQGLEILMFGISMFDKHTYSAAFHGPSQIVRQTISNLDMGNISKLAYHRYKGLSNIKQMIVWIVKHGMGRYIKDIPDNQTSYIYKHSMRDIRIFGYKGLVDMKV